jgi:mannosidase alpha-like ER degradation enhancer 2
LLLGIAFLVSWSGTGQTLSAKEKKELQNQVREACVHAWTGYMKYGKGYDALKPISKTGHNWYGQSLLMTPVDAFDTFILLGMKKEAREAKKLIFSNLNFNYDVDVQLFEVNIRLLGGLLSAHEVSKEEKFLLLARELADRLMPAFKSPTGMPYRYINLNSGATRDARSNPAEIGTYLLEFGKLTSFTGDSSYYHTAKKAALEVFRRRSDLDLIGSMIDVETGEWIRPECRIGAYVDSYFEYLYKAWLLFGDHEFLEAWNVHMKAIVKYLMKEEKNGWFCTRADMLSGKEIRPLYGALDAWFAGALALSGDTVSAAGLQQGNFHMWTRFNMEPEEFDFRKDSITHPGYPLRPENIESCFYLYRATGNDIYPAMGKRMVLDILKNTRTDAGFAAVKDVRTLQLSDSMESFFLAETLKYSWLLFHKRDAVIDLHDGVFNTEAHFFKR